MKVQTSIGISVNNIDKIAHFGIYFIFTLVWFGYLSGMKFKKSFKNNCLKASFLAFFVGVSIEILQQLITKERSAEVYDVLANSLGILIAVIMLYQIKKYKELKSVK